jgi:hypothetical protein
MNYSTPEKSQDWTGQHCAPLCERLILSIPLSAYSFNGSKITTSQHL